jgi:excisionase family DNA binding protein
MQGYVGGAMSRHDNDEELLTPAEVAAMFRVNPKTVTRWARAGKISAIRTLGGHRRFKASEIRAALASADASM